MKVIKAKTAGFCFGVKRAVDTVYEQVEKCGGKNIYTYGPIIHNEEVVKDMGQKGVTVLRSEEELDALSARFDAETDLAERRNLTRRILELTLKLKTLN